MRRPILATAAGVNYTYDGDGQRVEKSNGTLFWYGAGGEVLEETGLTGGLMNDYVFFAGSRVARRDAAGDVLAYFEDHLGSSRNMQKIAAGATTATLVYDADFRPYGRERAFTESAAPIYKFTGKMRDSESGLDDFGARYYSSTIGRFVSADWSSVPAPVPYANLANPQTLNLYAMVSDNPETFADLDGHQCGPAMPGTLSQCKGNTTTPPATGGTTPTEPQRNGTNTQNSTTQTAQQQNDHPAHEAAVVNQTTTPDANGNSSHTEALYGKAQNTSGNGQVGGEASAGVANVTVNTGGTGNVKGQVNVQAATADANGHIGLHGGGIGANARLVQYSGQIAFKVGSHTVTIKGTVSLIGAGGEFHIDWGHGFSAGGGAILLDAGASLNLSVTGGH